MAIEKHMLQTHSLFEKAGEVLEGVAKLKERIAELKQKLHDAEMQADLAECAVTEYKIDCDKFKDENRRLKRALWIARAERAIEKIAWFKLWNASISTMNPEDGAKQEYDKWEKALGKFIKKAEKFKEAK